MSWQAAGAQCAGDQCAWLGRECTVGHMNGQCSVSSRWHGMALKCSQLALAIRRCCTFFFALATITPFCMEFSIWPVWASCQIRKIAGCACAVNAGNVSPRRGLQRKPLVGDPGKHHSTCVTHVPWCMSGSLTRGGGENVPGIPGACATRNFAYLARGPWCNRQYLCPWHHYWSDWARLQWLLSGAQGSIMYGAIAWACFTA